MGKPTKYFEWKCPECGGKIVSVWKNQFEYNKKQHLAKHERKNEAKK